MSTYAYRQAAGIRQALLDRRELALIDVREEADFATAHPLFAVNLPLSKLELEVRRRIPRFTTPLTVYDNGEGLAEIAVERLRSWGYQDVALLAEGLAGWGSCFRTSTPPVKPLASWWKACVTHRRSAPRRFRRSSTAGRRW